MGIRWLITGIIKISFLIRSPIRVFRIYIVRSRYTDLFPDTTPPLVKIRISVEGNKVRKGLQTERKFSRVESFLTRATAKRNKQHSENSFSCTNLFYDSPSLHFFHGSNTARDRSANIIPQTRPPPHFFPFLFSFFFSKNSEPKRIPGGERNVFTIYIYIGSF